MGEGEGVWGGDVRGGCVRGVKGGEDVSRVCGEGRM